MDCARSVGRNTLYRVLFTATIVACALTHTGRCGAQAPLFESDSILELRIEAPFRRMTSEAEGRFPARLILTAGAGDTLQLELAPRGKSRLQSGICDFPGWMLFLGNGTLGSPFEWQGVLPLVSHCKDRDSFEQLLLLEFLSYRVHNLLTDKSLRVRLASIEYYDSERGRQVSKRLAFFLENYDSLATRIGWNRLELRQVPPDEYEPAERNLVEVFQYFIGNTDWSYSLPAQGETVCCHNVVPIGDPAGPVFPVPFDFDQAGLVNAPYATVDPSIPIRSVRERYYRGICGPSAELNATLGLFESYQTEIEELFENAEYLSARSRSGALSYVSDFFRTISDDRRVGREFLSRCRTP